jgi:hypothetical protein
MLRRCLPIITGADVLPLANLDFVQLRCFHDSVVLRSSDSEDKEPVSAAFSTASQQASEQKLRRPAFFFASDIRGVHSLCCGHSIRFMSLRTMSVCLSPPRFISEAESSLKSFFFCIAFFRGRCESRHRQEG